jgi:single-strand DNA-binding protein
MLNQVTIMGRLGRDPELRRTGSGTAVTSFSLAVDRDYTGKDGGERQTDWIDCVAWRNTAEFINSYFSKGRMAVVVGRLQVRDWTDDHGNKRKATEVIVDSIYFGDSKREATGSNGAPQADPPAQQFQVLDGDDETLPFF